MTKAARERRQRAKRKAEHAELLKLRSGMERVQRSYGGVGIQGVMFNEEMHARLDTARMLDFVLVVRRNFGAGERDWRVYAVKP